MVSCSVLGCDSSMNNNPQNYSFHQIAVLMLLPIWVKSVATTINFDMYTFPAGVLLKDGQQFDYIVVGAGAGGAVAASRLALAGYDVLLVEAGGDPNVLTKIPGVSLALMGSDLDWQYKTLPNKVSCLSSAGRQCKFSRGKGLGGSTSIHHMMYARGNRVDYDAITTPGWTYKDLMPYFLRYEGLQDLDQLPPSSKYYHNTTGFMRIGFFADSENPWHSRLINAFQSLQFPFNPDVNAESQIGVTQLIGYVYRAERMSTARGYLARMDVKRALSVAKNTMCTGVIIDENKVALGITAVQNFQSVKLFARKEVILSAGTIGTPQILLLSGVGPADHLKSMGIPVKVDLPVGNGMTDHVLPMVFLQVRKDFGPLGELELLTDRIPEVMQLLMENKGPLTSNGLSDVSVFANTHCYDFEQKRLLNVSSNGSDCNVPNLQVIMAYIERKIVSLAKGIFKHSTGLNDDIIDRLSEANEDYGFVMLCPVLLEPHSEGTVRLASKDPLVPPAIYPNYLGDKRDVEEIIRSMGIMEDLANTDVLTQASLLWLELPDCPRYEVDKQEYWRCYVRHLTYSAYHSAGTAALGTVLDARLRVRGVKRLRVADLSVLPRVPRSNPSAVTIAIGERVVDFILEDNEQYKNWD